MSSIERERQIFERACELEGTAREAYLSGECAGDDPLRARIEALIEADVGTENALDVPAVEGLRAEPPHPLGGRPESIGPYRVLGVLGAGGMGVVYEAEQEHPARRVALKVVRPGFVTESLLRRFEHEARVLGWLNHPGIAQIYEAGTHDTGHGPQPFFAMELVRGAPLLQHAEREQLDTGQRLELLAKVCDAVHHAHQKGVIHRDLKPGNVLVDQSGQPKVLDFGVARAIDSDLQATTLHTQTGELVGTLTYMSPEQVSGRPEAVDTRSDVYALGVIAHELLVGRPPLDLRGKLVHEAARAIAEDEPSTLGELRPELRGDVETIVSKSLEKEKERRYASAEELASDIRRFLDDEPIVARPASAMYQLTKFTRRNRALVGGAAVAFLALAVGAATSTWMYFDAEAARIDALEAQAEEASQRVQAQLALERTVEAEAVAQRAAASAEFEAAVATEVKDFLIQLLNKSNPLNSYGEVVTVEALLDRGTAAVLEGEHTPEVRAEILSTIGLSYLGMGRAERAVELMEAAVEAGRDIRGQRFQDARLRVMRRLGRAYIDVERVDEALPTLESARELAEQIYGRDHAFELRVRSNIGLALLRLGRIDEGGEVLNAVTEAVERRELEEAEGPEGQEVHDFIRAHRYYASIVMAEQGNAEGAVDQMRKVVAFYDGRGRHNDPHLVTNLTGLSGFLVQLGRHAEARAALLRALDIAEHHLPPDAIQTCAVLTSLGQADLGVGAPRAAEARFLRALEIYAANGWERHRDAAFALLFLSTACARDGRPEESLDHLLEAADIFADAVGPEHPHLASVSVRLEGLIAQAGHLREPAIERLTALGLAALADTLNP